MYLIIHHKDVITSRNFFIHFFIFLHIFYLFWLIFFEQNPSFQVWLFGNIIVAFRIYVDYFLEEPLILRYHRFSIAHNFGLVVRSFCISLYIIFFVCCFVDLSQCGTKYIYTKSENVLFKFFPGDEISQCQVHQDHGIISSLKMFNLKWGVVSQD